MHRLRLKALLSITAEKLDEKEDDDFIVSHFRFVILKLLSEKSSPEEVELSLKCLTNLCSTAHRNQLLLDAAGANCGHLVAKLKQLLHSEHRNLTLGLLCNLTRTALWLERFVDGDTDELLSSLFPSGPSLCDAIAVTLNLSTNSQVRRKLCSESKYLKRLVTSFDQESDQRIAISLAGVLKNCCFEDSYHMALLNDTLGLLDAFLLRLCGPQDEIHPDDRKLLPERVQAVVGTPDALRSDCFQLKTLICQALLQLCATSTGRSHLRARGVYFVLRELHKYEHSRMDESTESEATLRSYREMVYYLEQVVDQLICEERERDKIAIETSLRDIPVDEKTCEKLEKIKLDSLGCIEAEVDV